jgi:hypothetical protein
VEVGQKTSLDPDTRRSLSWFKDFQSFVYITHFSNQGWTWTQVGPSAMGKLFPSRVIYSKKSQGPGLLTPGDSRARVDSSTCKVLRWSYVWQCCFCIQRITRSTRYSTSTSSHCSEMNLCSPYKRLTRTLHSSPYKRLLMAPHSTPAREFKITLDGQTCTLKKNWHKPLVARYQEYRPMVSGWLPHYFAITQTGTDAGMLSS